MGPTEAERSRGVAAVFDALAPTYDAVGVPWFRPIAERLVHELSPAPGERALDIGCGRGAALFPLAEAVGSSGYVTGIDISPRMVEATRAEVAAQRLTHVEVVVRDAAGPELALAGYDVIASSLVVFFLPDPATALSRWRRLLAPGGRLGISTFGEQDPRWLAVDKGLLPYLPPQMLDPRTTGAAGPFASDAGVETLLRAAGFCRVRTTGADFDATFSHPQHWYDWSLSTGQRAMWEAVPEDRRAEVRGQAFAALERCRGTDGRIVLTQRVRFTVAQRGED